MNTNQQGFTAIAGLLIVIIVGIIGFTGWYVWHSKNSADKNFDMAANLNQKTTQNHKSDNLKINNKKDVSIVYWKVKATYTGSLDLEYSTTVGTKPEQTAFDSPDLDNSDPNCKASGSYGGLIVRYKSTDEFTNADNGVATGKSAAETAAALPKNQYGHVGDYFYFYVQPQAFCGSSQASHDIQTQTQNEVKTLLPSLTAITQ